MAYTPNIPQPTDATNASQPPILANFAALSTPLLGVDTAGFLFSDQSPSYTGSPANPIELFSRIAQNPVQVNENVNVLCLSQGGTITEFSGGINANPGWVRLPTGLILKWMTVTITAAAGGSSGVMSRVDSFLWATSADTPVFTGLPGVYHLTMLAGAAASANQANAFIAATGQTTTTVFLQIESYAVVNRGWTTFDVQVFALGEG